MKTIIKTLITVTMLIASFSTFAVDRFVANIAGHTEEVCDSQQSIAQLYDAVETINVRERAALINSKLCYAIDATLQFEVLAKNQYVAQIVFYDNAGNLRRDVTAWTFVRTIARSNVKPGDVLKSKLAAPQQVTPAQQGVSVDKDMDAFLRGAMTTDTRRQDQDNQGD